jgi:hypothetical protein
MAVSHLEPRRITESPDNRYTALSETEILERRLVEGERRIALAQARGEDTTRLVDFWIDLLHQYEQSVDALQAAA